MQSNTPVDMIKKPFKAMAMTIGLILAPLQSSQALEVQILPLANSRAVVVTVDVQNDNLQLFLKDSKGNLYQSFSAINQHLRAQQSGTHRRPLIFAMNAGMFHPGYLPVGLYIEQGRELYPLNTATGSGNFFMQPNGIFLLASNPGHPATNYRAEVMSTADFQQHKPQQVWLATQSGPLLVYNGKINSRFDPASNSRFIRNAVGVKQPDKAVFVMSEQAINLYELADFFKNTLQIEHALYLDGSISSLYLPALNRHDRRRFLGPIIGVTQQVN